MKVVFLLILFIKTKKTTCEIFRKLLRCKDDFRRLDYIYIYNYKIIKFNSISRRKNGWIYWNGNFSLESCKNILQRYKKQIFFYYYRVAFKIRFIIWQFLALLHCWISQEEFHTNYKKYRNLLSNSYKEK